MSSESPVIDREEVEHTLCQIAEIGAARVVSDDNNHIQELHIIASGQRSPRQIVRDIESILIARFGIIIDHKKISIAQIDSPPDTASKSFGRLKISTIAMDIRGHTAAFEVTLSQRGAECTGQAEGLASENGRLRLAALAVLDAASKHLSANSSLALDHASILPTGSGKVAVVCVSVMTRVGEEVYAGSAMVKTDECNAIVKAALSAINRHLR